MKKTASDFKDEIVSLYYSKTNKIIHGNGKQI